MTHDDRVADAAINRFLIACGQLFQVVRRHCWVFAEFALLYEGNRMGEGWLRKIEVEADKLKRLGWKKSASLLVVVIASRGEVRTEWGDELAGSAVWNQSALTDLFAFALPGGGSVVVKAFDIKRNPADTLTASLL